MNTASLTTFLRTVLRDDLRHSLMIWGPPGIGKSSIVAQVAAEAGITIIDVRLSQLAPTDLRGLPVPERLEDGSTVSRWYPPEFLPRSGRGILFMDELNMAAPSMQGVAQQLILDRRVGNYRLPDGWFVWAAGNRKEDRAAVFDMPTPLGNRFLHVEVQPDFDGFKAHAIEQRIDDRIVAFLSFRTDLLHRVDPNKPAWPSPRTWFMAHSLLRSALPLAPAIGEAAEAEFNAFIAVYESIPDLAAVLAGRGSQVQCPDELSAKYAVVVGLALRAADGGQATHAFRWISSRMSTEWTRSFVQDLFHSMKSKGLQGDLGRSLDGDPEFARFFDDFRNLLATR
jgi:MoxR-like ATPase